MGSPIRIHAVLCILNWILQCDAAGIDRVHFRLSWPFHKLQHIDTPTSSATSEFLASILDYAAATNKELNYTEAQKNYYPGIPVTEAFTPVVYFEEFTYSNLDDVAAALGTSGKRRKELRITLHFSDGKISRDERIVPTGTPSISHRDRISFIRVYACKYGC
eukprot:GHVU01073574.1.p1 GENE.GHVU01073574.1~~GHVU01073574.1.p1  ORF type:complete len:162 (-),score=4.03 GHVU01073574.1:340-825(-)